MTKLIYQKLTLSEDAQYRAFARGEKPMQEFGGVFAQRGHIISHMTAQVFNSIQKQREKANLYYVSHQLEVCILVNNISVHL